jgi:hypothetical protein
MKPPRNNTLDKEKRKYRFSGHQTFSFRYGWLEKGVRGTLERKSLFYREDAPVLLGVGKNMVDSIRYWCVVTQLIQENTNRKIAADMALSVSAIGERLLGEHGWDPYLEDDASLWLIHWLLVTNPRIVTTWQIAFSLFLRPDFTKREMIDHVAAFADRHAISIRESSLSRDVDCFIRTYAPAKSISKHKLLEESFDCPLQELGLLQSSPDGDLYRFSVGAKPTLPSHVLGFALTEYFDVTRDGRNTMSVQKCLYGSGSPGQVFKLDENSLIAYVDDLEKITEGGLALDETEGFKQIYRRKELDALRLLDNYFRKRK